MTIRDWDRHFMEKARHNASMSTCVSRTVGAVAYRDKRQIADGFNGNLPGQPHCNEGGCARCNDPERVSGVGLERCSCVHAEINVVAYCARFGVPLDGATMAITLQPCMDCLKAMSSAGVVEVIYDEGYYEMDASPITTSMRIRKLEL